MDGEITDEELNATAPIGVTLRLAGPSIDFIIGNIFSGAAETAYDKMVR